MDDIPALRVPGHTQPDREPECLLYSMWMVLQFANSVYPSEAVRSATPVISPAEMREFITIRESGWAPNQSDLDALSAETGPVNWQLKWWRGTPPTNTLFEVVEAGLEETVPTIVVVDVMRLRDLDRRGPLHAVVVVGMDDRRMVINDPWGSMYEVFPRDRVADAWDTTLNRVLTIDLTTQSTLNETLIPEEDES